MAKTSKLITAIVTVLLVIGIASVLVLNKSSKSPSGEIADVSLRLAWLPGATFAGDYLALNSGFWEEEGLTVEVRAGGFEFDAIKLVAVGEDTFGVTSGPQLLEARRRGVPIVAIAATIPDSPIGWVSKRDSGITEPADFVGKRIGAQFGTHTEITFEALVDRLDIPLDSMERVPIRFDPRPFVTGDIDVLPVYVIDQPIDLERLGLELNVIDPRIYGIDLAYGNLYFTTEEMVNNHPDVVRAFLAGADAGWRAAERDRSIAADAITTNATIPDRETLMRKIEVTFDFIIGDKEEYSGLSAIDPVRLQETAHLLSQYSDFPDDFEVAGSY